MTFWVGLGWVGIALKELEKKERSLVVAFSVVGTSACYACDGNSIRSQKVPFHEPCNVHISRLNTICDDMKEKSIKRERK